MVVPKLRLIVSKATFTIVVSRKTANAATLPRARIRPARPGSTAASGWVVISN